MKTNDVIKSGVLMKLRRELTVLHDAIQQNGAKITINVDYPRGNVMRTFHGETHDGDYEEEVKHRRELYEVIRAELVTALDEIDTECLSQLRDLGVEVEV